MHPSTSRCRIVRCLRIFSRHCVLYRLCRFFQSSAYHARKRHCARILKKRKLQASFLSPNTRSIPGGFARECSDNVINRVRETIRARKFSSRLRACERVRKIISLLFIRSLFARAEEPTKFCYFIAQEYFIYRTQEYSRKVLFRLICLNPDRERERERERDFILQ